MRARGVPQPSRDNNITARFIDIENRLFAVPPQHKIDVALLQHDNFIPHRVHFPHPPGFAKTVRHHQDMTGKIIELAIELGIEIRRDWLCGRYAVRRQDDPNVFETVRAGLCGHRNFSLG
jgi:hypothetical protein